MPICWEQGHDASVTDLTDDERAEVRRITRSHTLGAAFVHRAQIVAHAVSGLKAEKIASRMDLCGNTVRHWISRFNAHGLKGLEEDVRAGRPATYSAEQGGAVITATLTRPTELGLPFTCWILDRLVAYLHDHGIATRRNRISEIFIREGLKRHHDESWFGKRVDPAFANKRGSSGTYTRRRHYAVVDNLSTPDVLLFSLLHLRWEFAFQPRYQAIST